VAAEKSTKGRPAASPNQRDTTKRETREALLAAGIELFAEQGIDVPSLDALCARAGFTRGAFYVHFQDREAFIVAVMEKVTSSFLDVMLAANGAELVLADIIATFAELVSRGSFNAFGTVPIHQFLAACARSPQLRKRYVSMFDTTRDRLTEAVKRGQLAGKVRADIDAARAGGLLLAIGMGVGTMLELGVSFEAVPHARTLAKLFEGGGGSSGSQ
jgi:TetR/AcrR family transcriptional regulator, transcriptional repressor for nem operon